jgi:hypothetical protein
MTHRAQVVQHHQEVVWLQGCQGVGVVLQAEEVQASNLDGRTGLAAKGSKTQGYISWVKLSTE